MSNQDLAEKIARTIYEGFGDYDLHRAGMEEAAIKSIAAIISAELAFPAGSGAEVERLNKMLTQEAKDWADDDTAIRELCRPYTDVDGDSYAVPMLVDVVKGAIGTRYGNGERTEQPAAGPDSPDPDLERAWSLLNRWRAERRLLDQRYVTTQDCRVLAEWIAEMLRISAVSRTGGERVAEQSVESALAELREMFPGKFIKVYSRGGIVYDETTDSQHYTDRHAFVVIMGVEDFNGATLAEVLAAVRAYHAAKR